MMVSEWYYALRFGEAEGVWIGTILAGVVTSLTVVAVLACWAVPDGVSGVNLFTEATSVGEWDRSGGVTSQHIVVVVLQHGVPLQVPFVGVSNCGGQGDATNVHGFWSIVVRNEGGMIKIRMDA